MYIYIYKLQMRIRVSVTPAMVSTWRVPFEQVPGLGKGTHWGMYSPPQSTNTLFPFKDG